MEDGEDEDEEMFLGQQHSTAVIQVAWPVHNLIPPVTPHTSRLTRRHTNTPASRLTSSTHPPCTAAVKKHCIHSPPGLLYIHESSTASTARRPRHESIAIKPGEIYSKMMSRMRSSQEPALVETEPAA